MSFVSQAIGGSKIRLWVSGRSYVVGDKAVSPTDFCDYVRKVAGAGATDPSSDTTNWQPSGARAVKSRQYVTIAIGAGNTSGTATISSVNTAKTKIFHLGSSNENTTEAKTATRIVLTNSTTVTATGYTANGSTTSIMVEETF